LTATGDRDLRRALEDTLQAVPPSPVPLQGIIRRGRHIRLRRAGAAVGGLALAGIVAVASLALRADPQPTGPATAPAIAAGPGGVFASGTADGHPWRLAVQNIADPGYRCLPAITINGTDADQVYPAPGNAAGVDLGRGTPGTEFAFIQLAAGIGGVIINGQRTVPAVAVTACGYRYRLVGFSFSLAGELRVTLPKPYPGWPTDVFVPTVYAPPGAQAASAQTAGVWVNTDTAPGKTALATLASGRLPDGPDWFIKLQFAPGGDCYEFYGSGSLGSSQMGYCGPVSTPDGPETIMALPLGFPDGSAATGYAVQVSPSTDLLRATLSNGSTEAATLRVVAGRKYAAFIVPDPLHLAKLTWLGARGRIIASTTAAVPAYGYLQFQP
jgi:hypothetical protein